MKSPKIILDTIKKIVAETELCLSPEIKATMLETSSHFIQMKIIMI